MDRSTKPAWTIWFDNGCGIRYPSYPTNQGVYGYGSSDATNGNDIAYGGRAHITMVRMSRGSARLDNISNHDTSGFMGYDKEIKVVNPIHNDANKYDWSKCYGARNTTSDGKVDEGFVQRKSQFFRACYEIGILSEDEVITLGAQRKG